MCNLLLPPGTKGLTSFNMAQFLLKGSFEESKALGEYWFHTCFTILGFYNYVIGGRTWNSELELFVTIFNDT